MLDVVAQVEIELALLPSARKKRSGCRPNHKHPRTGEFLLGEVTFENGFVDPGEVARAQVRILASAGDLDSLLQFGSWSVWEATTHVAQVQVTGLISRAPLRD